MKLVIIESPYAGDVEENLRYAQWCAFDCLKRGEAPFASHLIYTQMLDDDIPEERLLGIEAGFSWGNVAECHVFYVDKGWSRGMKSAYKRAVALGRVIEIRALWRAVEIEELPHSDDN